MTPPSRTPSTPAHDLRPDADQRPTDAGRRRRLVVGIAAAVVVLIVGALVWYLSQDAPAAVDIDAAAAALAEDAAAEVSEDDAAADASTAEASAPPVADGDDNAEDTAAATAPADADGLSGTWVVDTSIGTFSVTETTGTFVGFRVAEELTTLGQVEAVGRTPDVSGTVTVDGTTLTAGEITADMTGIVSDESRREGAIQRALDTATHPTAAFTTSGPVELGGDLSDGAVVAVDVPGTLTIAGTAQDVEVPLQMTRQGDTVIVTGALDISFADYGVEAPSAPIVVSVEDAGQIELQLHLTRS